MSRSKELLFMIGVTDFVLILDFRNAMKLEQFEQFEQFLLKNIEYRPQWGIGTVNYYNNGITAIGTSAITYVHSTNPGTNTNTLAITNK